MKRDLQQHNKEVNWEWAILSRPCYYYSSAGKKERLDFCFCFLLLALWLFCSQKVKEKRITTKQLDASGQSYYIFLLQKCLFSFLSIVRYVHIFHALSISVFNFRWEILFYKTFSSRPNNLFFIGHTIESKTYIIDLSFNIFSYKR